MKKNTLFLAVTLILSACQGTTPNNSPAPSQNSSTVTTGGTTSASGGAGQNTSTPSSDSILYSWQDTLPAEFKNLSEGQTDYKIATNSAGDAVVTWLYEDSAYKRHIYVSHRRNSVWTHPTFGSPLKVNDSVEQKAQKALINEAGEVKLFFSEAGTLYLREFKNNSWQTPVSIATYPYQSHMSTKFAFSPNGKIMILTSSNGDTGIVYFNGTSWTNTGVLTFRDSTKIATAGLEYIDIALNDSGKAIFSFNHYFPIYIHYRNYRATFDGSTWTMPASKEDPITFDKGSFSKVAINNAGKMVSVWQSDDGRIHIQENNGTGWEDEAYTHGNPGTPFNFFMNESGQYNLITSEPTRINTFKRNGIFMWLEQSIPTTGLNKFEVTKTSPNDIVITWSGTSTIGYARCSFSNCDSGKIISEAQLGASGTPVTKTLGHVEASSSRVIAFWDARSSDSAGGSNNEIGGSEDLASSSYNMPLINFKRYGPPE